MATVGVPAVIGAASGAAVGFFTGGPAGAVTGGQLGIGLGVKVGLWIWGTKTVEGIASQTTNKVLSLVKKGSQYLFAGGLITFAYFGASRYVQDNCTVNPQHQTCQIVPYVHFGILLFSVASIVTIVSKSILNINHKLNPSPPLQTHLPEENKGATSTVCNPSKSSSKIGSSYSESSLRGVKLTC